MSYPWFISRASHDEIVAILREQIEELKAERKLTVNYILQQSAGRGLFDEVAKPIPVQEVGAGPAYFGAPINEGTRRNPRAFIRKLQEEVNRDADAMADARKIVDDTIKEGQASA